MIKRGLALLPLLLVACGGSGGQVAPVPEAEASLRDFLQAAADSNFAGMSANWGTARGPASETGQPADYQRRMVIIQAYLHGSKFRVLSNEPAVDASNQRVLQVELSRSGCVNVVPFTMVRTGGGRWVVNQFDLEKVGSPSRACGASDTAPR